MGFVYPAYASYKALETKTPEASAQWLTYWYGYLKSPLQSHSSR